MRMGSGTLGQLRQTEHVFLHRLVVQRDGDDSAPEDNVRVGNDICCLGRRDRPGSRCQLTSIIQVSESVRILLSVRRHVDCVLYRKAVGCVEVTLRWSLMGFQSALIYAACMNHMW